MKIPPLSTPVIDNEGYSGKITDIQDIHNVWVTYDNDSGSGVYCLDENCPDFDPLIVIEEKPEE